MLSSHKQQKEMTSPTWSVAPSERRPPVNEVLKNVSTNITTVLQLTQHRPLHSVPQPTLLELQASHSWTNTVSAPCFSTPLQPVECGCICCEGAAGRVHATYLKPCNLDGVLILGGSLLRFKFSFQRLLTIQEPTLLNNVNQSWTATESHDASRCLCVAGLQAEHLLRRVRQSLRQKNSGLAVIHSLPVEALRAGRPCLQ